MVCFYCGENAFTSKTDIFQTTAATVKACLMNYYNKKLHLHPIQCSFNYFVICVFVSLLCKMHSWMRGGHFRLDLCVVQLLRAVPVVILPTQQPREQQLATVYRQQPLKTCVFSVCFVFNPLKCQLWTKRSHSGSEFMLSLVIEEKRWVNYIWYPFHNIWYPKLR